MDAYARNHGIPAAKPEKGVRKEDFVRPYLERMIKQNRHGVYMIIPSMEKGPCFHPAMPKYPTNDPKYWIVQRRQRMYTHLYFYIRDEVLGPLAMCAGTYLPFQTTYYLNGHCWIENQLRQQEIQIHHTRMLRLMEVLVHHASQLQGWRTADIQRAVLPAFGLKPESYTLTQLRYDLRKMKAHGLLERDGKRYRYRLTVKGAKVALLFVLFHKRVCGPLAHSLFERRPNKQNKPNSKLEKAYYKADAAIQSLLDQLAMAAGTEAILRDRFLARSSGARC